MKDHSISQFLTDTFNYLLGLYGPQHWWPSDSDFETAIGAILTQSTSWRNVEKAITNLKNADILTPKAILSTDIRTLRKLVRPARFFNQKAARVKLLSGWWLKNAEQVEKQRQNWQLWRESLLAINGVGPETADTIMLYCFNIPIFVIDTYTKRMFIASKQLQKRFEKKELESWKYAKWQQLFMENLPSDPKIFNELHALIVRHNKEIGKFTPW